MVSALRVSILAGVIPWIGMACGSNDTSRALNAAAADSVRYVTYLHAIRLAESTFGLHPPPPRICVSGGSGLQSPSHPEPLVSALQRTDPRIRSAEACEAAHRAEVPIESTREGGTDWLLAVTDVRCGEADTVVVTVQFGIRNVILGGDRTWECRLRYQGGRWRIVRPCVRTSPISLERVAPPPSALFLGARLSGSAAAREDDSVRRVPNVRLS